MLLKDAEAVSHYLIVIVNRNEYGAVYICEKQLQFFLGILSADFEDIRSSIMVTRQTCDNKSSILGISL